MLNLDIKDVVRKVIKYLVEGLAVGVAAYMIPTKKLKLEEIGVLAVTAALVLAILDTVAPRISGSARQGAGFGLGAGIVRWMSPMPVPGVPPPVMMGGEPSELDVAFAEQQGMPAELSGGAMDAYDMDFRMLGGEAEGVKKVKKGELFEPLGKALGL
jgi:hypothetical protein